MSKIDKLIAEYVDGNKETIIREVQEFCRIPSVSGNEGAAQEWIADKLKKAGFEVELFQADYETMKKHPAFVETGLTYENRPNVIGVWKGSNPNGKSMTLSAHSDVVDTGPSEMWKFDPWSATIEDGKIYGRGTKDCKSGVMISYYALKCLKDLGIKLKGTAMVLIDVDEEVGGSAGMLACMQEERFHTDGLWSIDTTDWTLIHTHAGSVSFKIRVEGKAAHGGMPQRGVNAIRKMGKITDAIFALADERAKIKYAPFEAYAGNSAPLNIGMLNAGVVSSAVPGLAQIEGTCNFIPGETENQIKELITKTVMDVANQDEWMKEHLPEIEWFGWHCEPWYQDPEHPFLQAYASTVERFTGSKPPFVGTTTGLDTQLVRYVPSMAAFSAGTKGGFPHGVNEHVNIDSLLDVIKVAAMLVTDWCGVDE